mgnify:FL=1
MKTNNDNFGSKFWQLKYERINRSEYSRVDRSEYGRIDRFEYSRVGRSEYHRVDRSEYGRGTDSHCGQIHTEMQSSFETIALHYALCHLFTG